MEENTNEFWENLKKEKNYKEPESKKPSDEPKSERDLFRVVVDENGLVKKIITINN
jgi:hypothetical protein